MQTLQKYLKTQAQKIKYCMDDSYKKCVTLCKQPHYTMQKKIDLESVNDMMEDTLELILDNVR